MKWAQTEVTDGEDLSNKLVTYSEESAPGLAHEQGRQKAIWHLEPLLLYPKAGAERKHICTLRHERNFRVKAA